jgi:hypothetical protein
MVTAKAKVDFANGVRLATCVKGIASHLESHVARERLLHAPQYCRVRWEQLSNRRRSDGAAHFVVRRELARHLPTCCVIYSTPETIIFRISRLAAARLGWTLTNYYESLQYAYAF